MIELLIRLRRFRVKFCGDLFGEYADEFPNKVRGQHGRSHLHDDLVNNYVNPLRVDHGRGRLRSLSRLYNPSFGRRRRLRFRRGDINLALRGFGEGKTIQAGCCYGFRLLSFDERRRFGCRESGSSLINYHRPRKLGSYAERQGSIGCRLHEFRRRAQRRKRLFSRDTRGRLGRSLSRRMNCFGYRHRRAGQA